MQNNRNGKSLVELISHRGPWSNAEQPEKQQVGKPENKDKNDKPAAPEPSGRETSDWW